jgi:branched-chain amino acid transport system substrate-binding protein
LLIGFDAETGNATSTSDEAILAGMQIAVEEINLRGGVLGRPLAIEVRDNRSVPSRGVANAQAFAANPDVVAFVTGKFSNVVLEQLSVVHAAGIVLLDAWAAADAITQHDFRPGYTFRVSLTDSTAMAALLARAAQRGLRKAAVFAPNNGWGRSNLAAIDRHARQSGISLVTTQWYNWGGQHASFAGEYAAMRQAGADFVLMIANEPEGATLVKDIAALPKADRLPLLSHWGILGGDFPAMTGAVLHEVDLSVVTTVTYRGARNARARAVLQQAASRLRLPSPNHFPSVAGAAHAYDIVHLLALAIRKAGTAERAAVRAALEQIDTYDGVVKRFAPPFSQARHDALSSSDLRIIRFGKDGTLMPDRARPSR